MSSLFRRPRRGLVFAVGLLALTAPHQACAQEEKKPITRESRQVRPEARPGQSAREASRAGPTSSVGKGGLTLEGKIDADDPKVQLIVGNRSVPLPAKMFSIKLTGGKKYRITMDSKELDGVLVIQNQSGRQLAWDDDGGGRLNSLLMVDVVDSGIFKVFAATLQGSGHFALTIAEDGTIKIHDVGVGLKIEDELRKSPALIYNVNLARGKTYVIDMVSPNQKALDPYLRLLDADAKVLVTDDDGGEGLNARIIYRPETSGTYQILATSPGNIDRGRFTLTVRERQKADLTFEQQQQVLKARELHDKAFELFQKAQYAKAIDLENQALKIRKDILGQKHVDYAKSLEALGFLHHHQGADAKAERLFQEALAIVQAARGEKHLDNIISLNGLAVLNEARGEYARAEPLFLRCQVIVKESLGEDNADYGTSLSNLAGLYQSQMDYAKAEPLRRQALEIYQRTVGEKDPRFLAGLNGLATLYESQGKYAKAEPLLLKSLEIRKEVFGEKHPQYATGLNNLGSFYQARGDYTKAERFHLESLAISKEVFGEKSADYALRLNNLSVLYQARGDHSKAEEVCLKALEIRRQVLGEKHADYALSLDNLAVLYRERGAEAKAEPLFRQALQIRKELLGEKHPKYAVSLSNLARVYASQGKHSKAEALYRTALEIREAALGEKHLDYAQSLSDLADLYELSDDRAKAEGFYLKSLEIKKTVLGEKHREYASGLISLARLYHHQGNYAKGEPLLRRAVDIHKEVLGEQHPEYAASLHNLARWYNSQGRYTEAEALDLKAVEIYKQTIGEKHRFYASSLMNLAFLYLSQQQFAKAEPLCLKVVESRKELLGEKHPDYAMSLHLLAGVYLGQDRHAEAARLYEQALKIKKEVLGDKHPSHVQTLNNLGLVYEAQADYAKAEAVFLEAIDICRIKGDPVPLEKLQPEDLRVHQMTALVLHHHFLAIRKKPGVPLRWCDHSLSLALAMLDRVRQQDLDHEESRIQMTGESYALFPERIELLAKLYSLEDQPEDLKAAFWTAEQGTARAFLDSLSKSRLNLLAGISAELQLLEKKFLQALRELDRRIDHESAQGFHERNPDLIAGLFDQHGAAEKNLRGAIARIEAEYPQYAALKYPRPCTVEEARACLAADEVALLFVPGWEKSWIVLLEGRPQADDPALGLAVFELPKEASLVEHIAQLTDRDTLALPARVKALGRAVFDSLLGPCKERIQAKNLVIVPGGALSLLPFELLVEEDGKFLVENHRIRYAPSLTALHLMTLWKQKRAVPDVPLFAVGNAVYSRTGGKPGTTVAASRSQEMLRDLSSREGKDQDFQRLVHSGHEVAAIGKLLGAEPEYVLTGARATEAGVKEASRSEKMAKARYVHFATHGILGLDTGKQPALVLNLVGNNDAKDEIGVNDGFLQMDEIAGLKLNADLVVLSACRTGQGRMARGEGVTGLARAFLYAGSKGVVCSLWSVDDRETSNLMVDFYRHLQKGRPAADALRQAQLAMLRAGKAPLYWAPFILIGE